MSEFGNGQIVKTRGNYTGERLKSLRPETYREVVQLLAEPREHVSIREICRRCHVTDDTVRAVEQRETVPIAARKQELMLQAARIAKRAADRVEDQIDDAPLPQAVVTFGVMTDKIVLLHNDVAAQVPYSVHPGPDLSLLERLNRTAEKYGIPKPDPSETNWQFNFLNRWHSQLSRAQPCLTEPSQPLPEGRTVPDSDAGTGPIPQKETS
jgi:hypothetical protein